MHGGSRGVRTSQVHSRLSPAGTTPGTSLRARVLDEDKRATTKGLPADDTDRVYGLNHERTVEATAKHLPAFKAAMER